MSVVARTDSRPCVVRRPSMAAGYFSLLVQREVTKRKTPSRSRSRGHPCPRDCASRLRGSPTVRPCTDVELAGILPAIAVATNPPPARRGREGPGKSEERGSPCRRSKRLTRRSATNPLSRLRERARVRAIWVHHSSPALHPSEQRRRADGSAAQSAVGAMDRADSAAGHGWPVSRTRPPVANPRRRRGRGSEGAVFFGYFLLGKQKKVTGRHGWRTKSTRT